MTTIVFLLLAVIRQDSQKSEKALQSALNWLAQHQSPNGGWETAQFGDRCTGERCIGKGSRDFDVGVTGLALLAFFGSKTLDDGSFSQVIAKGLKWLLERQDEEGCFGDRGQKYLYNHAIASVAIAEFYGRSHAEALKTPAQKAINFLIAAQNPGRGWRYQIQSGDNDTSVTGWR